MMIVFGGKMLTLSQLIWLEIRLGRLIKYRHVPVATASEELKKGDGNELSFITVHNSYIMAYR